jgi:hypothetical protein
VSLFDNLLTSVAGWLADHSYPTVAGFIGGLVGTHIALRWRTRKRRRR